ncbi:Uncharacterized protein Fot_53145 [Forsythia ovata]|uniref:Late embryogenesis abundant protein 1-like n=1 Tax=Forsythia ovata TaxID=205694 RepID=A0ABD1PHT6_9LAMI
MEISYRRGQNGEERRMQENGSGSGGFIKWPHQLDSYDFGRAKTEEWMESAKNTTQSAHDKACDVANNTEAQAQQSKEENAGFLQQTGEQVANMAQGAIDGVKNTLGMGSEKK